MCAWLERVLFELAARFDSELAERLAEVVVDGAGTDEQLRGDFLVCGPLCCEPGDVCFLGGEVIAGIDGPFTRVLAGRLELDPGAFGERFHPKLRE